MDSILGAPETVPAGKLLASAHAPELRHFADVVAVEVAQHVVLGLLLVVIEESAGKLAVFLLVRAAADSARQRARRHFAVAQAEQELWRSADNFRISEFEVVHKGRRVYGAQFFVHRERVALYRVLGPEPHFALEGVARPDALLHLLAGPRMFLLRERVPDERDGERAGRRFAPHELSQHGAPIGVVIKIRELVGLLVENDAVGINAAKKLVEAIALFDGER